MMKTLLARLALTGSALFAIGWTAPDLIRDTAHRGQWVATRDWVAAEAECTRYSFVVSYCSVTAVPRLTPESAGRDLAYSSFASWGGESIEFVRSASDPDVIALRQAADGLVGRWAVMLVLLFVLFRTVVPARPRGTGARAPTLDPSAGAVPGVAAPGREVPGGSGPRKTFGARVTPPSRTR